MYSTCVLCAYTIYINIGRAEFKGKLMSKA